MLRELLTVTDSISTWPADWPTALSSQSGFRSGLAARKSKSPLRVLGLDWDTDESLIRLPEYWLISTLPTLLPDWKLGNDNLPSLVTMSPVLATQVTGELDDFLRFTDDMRRAKAAQAKRAAGR
jgi:hypothetical protein